MAQNGNSETDPPPPPQGGSQYQWNQRWGDFEPDEGGPPLPVLARHPTIKWMKPANRIAIHHFGGPGASIVPHVRMVDPYAFQSHSSLPPVPDDYCDLRDCRRRLISSAGGHHPLTIAPAHRCRSDPFSTGGFTRSTVVPVHLVPFSSIPRTCRAPSSARHIPTKFELLPPPRASTHAPRV